MCHYSKGNISFKTGSSNMSISKLFLKHMFQKFICTCYRQPTYFYYAFIERLGNVGGHYGISSSRRICTWPLFQFCFHQCHMRLRMHRLDFCQVCITLYCGVTVYCMIECIHHILSLSTPFLQVLLKVEETKHMWDRREDTAHCVHNALVTIGYDNQIIPHTDSLFQFCQIPNSWLVRLTISESKSDRINHLLPIFASGN